MTDELNDLRAALKRAPASDPEARTRALTLAMENFDRLQGSGEASRHKEDRPGADAPRQAGFFGGVRQMMKFLTAKPALLATTSAAALVVGVAIFLPLGNIPGIGGGTTGVTGAVSPGSNIPAQKAPAPEPALTASSLDVTAGEAPVVTEPAAAPQAAAKIAADEVAALGGSPKPAPQPENPQPGAAARTTAEAVPVDQAEYAAAASSAVEMLAEAPSQPMNDARLRMSNSIMPAGDMAYLPAPAPSTEIYANAVANPVKVTVDEPVSTFSTDIDTASWSVIRSTLNAGILPAPEQVRVEEMVNYFPYAYAAPEGDEAFATTVAVMPTPWNPETRLVTIGLQGALPEIAARPPLNLVFLVDTSGSMQDMNKLPLLKQSLALMLPELRPKDQVAIVAYAGSAGTVLEPTPAGERDKILNALDSLSADGSTAGAEGLELAYQLAAKMAGEGEVSRILLATDGDFNVGVSDPGGLEAYVAKKRAGGTYLSVLGFGRGNLDDAVMQALAQNGNGTASYIDSLSEARKVLVDQLTGALFPIADDVKVQVEWNPAQVAEYRLIGYETRALAREDFNNDKVDAGEIGAGLQVTAIYEVTAPGSAGLKNDPLRYGSSGAVSGGGSDEMGFLRLRWKEPGESISQLKETPITGLEPASDETRFAAAIAGFGQLLQGSAYTGDWGYDDAIKLALAARGADEFGYRIEAVTLMRLAQSLAK
ncbi:VWA domain-containing protein [Rhodobacter sp. 24-YEA-8]|uniref:vWA domain-containing protein n=1 Tax=Rhodobacter sp. 24-YEA-8 TaxID=1884310 RepID=UPI00089AE23E|nr:VWA domain-containing protein [Rhodobacter sp. 24-YEA-8]SEC37788.1 Ca-activated chloride channel family protein [Rhodobacter sp. 24-YEA-8]